MPYISSVYPRIYMCVRYFGTINFLNQVFIKVQFGHGKHIIHWHFILSPLKSWIFQNTLYAKWTKLKKQKKNLIWSYTFFLYTPNCSTTSGGKTRDAKARLKMALNSLSKPPIPIFWKSHSGLMMDWRGTFLKTHLC